VLVIAFNTTISQIQNNGQNNYLLLLKYLKTLNIYYIIFNKFLILYINITLSLVVV
jgi:hypothetical protein